jgi:hypothetical protein
VDTCTIQGLNSLEVQALLHKPPLSIAILKPHMQKIDHEAQDRKYNKAVLPAIIITITFTAIKFTVDD